MFLGAKSSLTPSDPGWHLSSQSIKEHHTAEILLPSTQSIKHHNQEQTCYTSTKVDIKHQTSFVVVYIYSRWMQTVTLRELAHGLFFSWGLKDLSQSESSHPSDEDKEIAR